MITVELARRLRDVGVRWTPSSGDRFVVADRDMDGDVFVISDMTVEVQELVDRQVIGFNGTTEWAMDSVEVDDVLWLPREDQLRALLGARFAQLAVDGEGAEVTVEVGGRSAVRHVDVECAYASALLELLA
ncbi:hypothetical protein GCM10027446_07000 [Angustibacter peucedani]